MIMGLRLLNAFWASTFFSILLCTYAFFVQPLFSYMGYDYSFNLFKLIFSYFSVIFLFYYLPYSFRDFSDVVLNFFKTFALMPALVLFSLAGFTFEYIFLYFLVLFIFFIVFRTDIFFKLGILLRGVNISVMLIISYFVVFSSLVYFAASFDLSNLIFSLNIDYEQRELLATSRGGSYLLSIFVNLSYKVFNIFLICYFLFKKRYLNASFFIIIHFLFFSLTLNRGIFFDPFAIIAIWYFFRSSFNFYKISLYLSVLFLIMYILYVLFDYGLLLSLLGRRFFFVPAYLAFDYVNFFTSNDFLFWGNSFLSQLVEYDFYNSIQMEIGNFNHSDSYSNNGIIGSGYAHAGYFGVAIYALIFALTIKFIEVSCKKNIPLWFLFALCFTNIRGIILNADLFMSFITNGFLIVIILLISSDLKANEN